ncbi:ABC transporter ATP-binding protein [Paramaledivibacter caminithermalis]|jgi:simple sugar transport system ATP-binding protein|uniref:Nucleoside ABC transporter ATP-binding protein n=1 Tax=Paramaledivibacter caminithermalis (strain DSM 15212 / CIP 107654 / DViRD3) TaxID=1121301 RepID=A0A1M6RBR3_PARC5|nr:ABC transporter ATP-binding protein [Paramaledivibacter caminithermalis]SHK29788.1 nucleoside ABC transporter ATP-binding protein [Paramaledivibacter caminithermalis DSM 15212]
MSERIIELKNVSKQFPSVLANDNISLHINKGEIYAIVGENGAGKSTLMKTMYGLHEPTSGEVYIKGEKIKSFSPSNSIKRGIGMVHQHFMLVPSFTIAENIVLGSEPRSKRIFSDKKKAVDIVKSLSRTYGLEVDPNAKIQDVSVGIQQRVEILKTLYKGADILILDEPTAVLTPQETEELFKVIKRLVNELDKTVIIITHKLNEVLTISDRVAVMRQGKLVDVVNTREVNEKILAELMVGREVLLEDIDKPEIKGEEVVRVKDLVVKDNRGFDALKGVSFHINKGEILGVAGIEGNGQSELTEALAGMRKIEVGHVFIKGIDATGFNPKKIRELGVAHIPEDRLVTGLSKVSSITDNILMGSQFKEEFCKNKLHLKRDKIRDYAKKLIKKFDVRTPSEDVKVGSLSGGNMQKVVIAREFSFNTEILLISQPTRGVDIGAIEFIHDQIIKKRNEGCAILLISAELDEIFRLSDRIITLYEGKVTGEFKNGEITKNEIGYYMTGNRKEQV